MLSRIHDEVGNGAGPREAVGTAVARTERA